MQLRFIIIITILFSLIRLSGEEHSSLTHNYSEFNVPSKVFLQVRKNKTIKFKKKPQQSYPNSLTISEGAILKLTLSPLEYSRRLNAEKNNIGQWRRVRVKNSSEDLYFFDYWKKFRSVRLGNGKLSIKSDGQDFYITQTPIYKKDGDYQLKYTTITKKSRSANVQQSLSLAPGISSEITHDEFSQLNSIGVDFLRKDKPFAKYLASEFDLLKKNVKLYDRVDPDIILAKNIEAVKNKKYSRSWLVTKKEELGDSDVDITIIREDIDISLDNGFNLNYGNVNLRNVTDLTDVEYLASGITFGYKGFLPVFLDLEMSLKFNLFYPTNETYTDLIKNREYPIDKIANIEFEHMFNYYFTTKNTGSIEWGLGIGSSFRGMFGKVVGFGYDSLLGITAQGSLFFKRLVASFKISPIGNSFNFNASNIESQLHIGFRLVDNSYSRDYILYFQANKLKYNPTNILLIDSTSYMAGVSLGF